MSFAISREMTVHALLPCRPPIVVWDKEKGSSQNVTVCIIEDGTCIEVVCGGTLQFKDCCCADDGLCCCD